MYKKPQSSSHPQVSTSASTLNPVFKAPIVVKVQGGTVTFFIREGQQPSNDMISAMQNHGVKLSS
jgi:hypothetical protein